MHLPLNSYEPEEDILREAALRFLNSNERMVNDELCMSDGSMQDYCLSRDDLDMSAIGEAYRLVSHHLNEALNNNGLNIKQCQVILVGKAATDYFENIFGQMALFYTAKKVTEKEKNLMIDRLLGMVKKTGYQVSKLFSTTHEVMEAHIVSKETTVSAELPVVDVVALTPADKRKVRVMKAEINAKLRGNDLDGAYAAFEEFKGWIIQKGFTELNAELRQLSEMMDGVKRNVKKASEKKERLSLEPNPESDSSKKNPAVDLKKFRREFHRETADIKALARTGRKDDARIALDKLEARLLHDGIKEFEVALSDIRKEYSLGNDAVVKKNSGICRKDKV